MTDNHRSPEEQFNPEPGAPRTGPPVFSPPPSLPAPPANPSPTAPAPHGAFFETQPPSTPPPTDTGKGRRSNVVFWVFGVLALIVGLLLFLGSRDNADQAVARSVDDNPGTESVPDDEDADSGGPSFFADPVRPDSVAIDGSSVWVSDAACGVVVQIDKATEEVVGAVNIGGSASGIAVAAGSVWVGGRDLGRVFRVDIAQMAVAGSVDVPGFALGLTAEGDEVWVTDSLLGSVYRIDASRSALAETVEVGADPHHVAIGPQTVWVTNQDDDTVSMIPRGRAAGVIEVPVGDEPLHVELGAGSAWITDSADSAVRRVDANTGESLAVIDVGIWPHALAFANGFVWVGTEAGSFWKIDPATNNATRVEDADFQSIDTAVDGADIWIADASGGTVVRFDAAAGSVGSVVDLNEFGDCQSFRDEAFNPPSPDISL